MRMHLGASWVQKGFKNVFSSCPNPSENFPDFSGIYSHFSSSYFYLLEGSKIFFMSTKYFICDCSCPNVSLGIFLEFWEFSEYFLCCKTFSRKNNKSIPIPWSTQLLLAAQ
jgi:hypothetical protein